MRRCTFVLFSLTLTMAALGASGCATENKMLKTPRYMLSYPDYWKVQSVAHKDGEPTHITIGKYSETVMNTGEAATADSQYETQMADVDVRIFAWPAQPEANDLNVKAAEMMLGDPDLHLDKQGRMPDQRDECGKEFKRKFTLLGAEHDTLDLASRPGHRMILVAGQSDGSLVGVVSRVPYEQDVGLYCYNLHNMRVQLQTVLDGIKTVPVASAPPGAAPPSQSGGAPPSGGVSPPAGGGAGAAPGQ